MAKKLKKYWLKNKKAFTLMEVLLIIGVIVALVVVIFISLNPTKQLAQKRNIKRWSDVTTLANALKKYETEHKSILPKNITISALEICKTGVKPAKCISEGLIDLSALTNKEAYLLTIPIDSSCPNNCKEDGTGYFINKTIEGKINIVAPNAELGESISIIK